MSNVNAPFGFRYLGDVSGGSLTDAFTYAIVQSTNTTAIFAGDPVSPDGSGFIVQATAGTTQLNGIFRQVEYLNSAVARNIWSPYWPGAGNSGNGSALIQANPFSLFVAQSNNTAIARADIGANVNFAIGTGSTLTGQSGASIDQSTITTTNTLPFKIYGLWSDYAPPGAPGSDDTSAFNWAVVTFNNVFLKQLTGIA
jgi:hypothetical protein